MRRRFGLCALLGLLCVLPASVRAQDARVEQPPSNRIVSTFLGFGRPYGAWLVQAFDSIPESKYGFKPTPVQQSVAYIAQHLEDANYQLCTLFSGAKRVVSAKDSLADTVKARWPKDTLVVRVRKSLEFCGNAIRTLTDANLTDEMLAGPPGAQVTVNKTRWLILLVTDLAEHYSQIAGYMRIMGMVPPSALPVPPPR